MSRDVEDCFNNLVSSIKKQGYSINNKSYNGFNVSIEPRKISVNIDAEITTTKSGSQRYNGFKIESPSTLYRLLQTVQSMINTISTTCTFNSYNVVSYPDYDINWYSTINSSTVYTVRDRRTNNQFNFATRRCVVSI